MIGNPMGDALESRHGGSRSAGSGGSNCSFGLRRARIDVILATGIQTMQPLQAATRTVPIAFMFVTDPVGQGFIQSQRCSRSPTP